MSRRVYPELVCQLYRIYSQLESTLAKRVNHLLLGEACDADSNVERIPEFVSLYRKSIAKQEIAEGNVCLIFELLPLILFLEKLLPAIDPSEYSLKTGIDKHRRGIFGGYRV